MNILLFTVYFSFIFYHISYIVNPFSADSRTSGSFGQSGLPFFLTANPQDHMLWGALSRERTAVWDLLPEKYADRICYYAVLEAAGALDSENISALVEHLPQASVEVIAYLLRYQEKNRKFADFFDNFSL